MSEVYDNDLRQPIRMSEEFIAGCALGAKMAARDRRSRVAFNGNQLAILVMNQLSASHRAIGTDRARHLSVMSPSAQVPCLLAHGFVAGTVGAGHDLPYEGPPLQQVFQHGQHSIAVAFLALFIRR